MHVWVWYSLQPRRGLMWPRCDLCQHQETHKKNRGIASLSPNCSFSPPSSHRQTALSCASISAKEMYLSQTKQSPQSLFFLFCMEETNGCTGSHGYLAFQSELLVEIVHRRAGFNRSDKVCFCSRALPSSACLVAVFLSAHFIRQLSCASPSCSKSR